MPDNRGQTEWEKKFYGTETKLCQNCGEQNKNGFIKCWNCGKHVANSFPVSFQYKYGNKVLGEKKHRANQDYIAKNGKDLIQPFKYDKHKKKHVKNKDFVKNYGDPAPENKMEID